MFDKPTIPEKVKRRRLLKRFFQNFDLPDVFSFLSAGWIVTAFLLFGRKVFVYRRFNRWLFKNNNKAEEKEQLDTLLLCREKLRIRRQVEVYGNPFIHSPILTGFFHPVIVVPAGRIPLEKLEFAFMHELIHLKRRDMFYKWLVQIVICIHWFNPFVYPLAREIEKACELSCDEAVVAAYGETAKKAYGDTLVSFIRAKTEGEASFAAVTLTEGVKQIEERLGEIMDYKKKSKGCRLCMIGFAVAVCVCFIASGAYSVPAEAQESMLWERIRELEAGEEEQRELDKVEEQLREWEAQQSKRRGKEKVLLYSERRSG